MRVCAINGSLRCSHGATHKILESFGKGVERAGGSWDLVQLAELKIEGCRACNQCQTTHSFKCIFDSHDDTARVHQQMMQADLLVYASPVYVFGMSSLLKRLIERFHCRAPIEDIILTQSGLFFHATDRSLTGKRFVSLVVCDNIEDLTVRNTADYFRIFACFMDAPQVARIERRSAAAWLAALEGADERERGRAQQVLAAFEQAGAELVKHGCIFPRTKRKAEQPFIRVPFLVRLARHIPLFRGAIEAEVRKRAGVVMGHDRQVSGK
ncbi:MAG: flavodoxin family protein [Thermoguttaceae bacterium]